MNSNILHWSYRDFHALPTDLIDHSDTLEEIYLKENFLPILPQWFFEFVHLKFIQLSGNLLQIIPDEIANLINLEHLDLSKNQLKHLPVQLTALNKLQYLNVSENEITALPKGMSLHVKFEIPELKYIDLFYSGIKHRIGYDDIAFNVECM